MNDGPMNYSASIRINGPGPLREPNIPVQFQGSSYSGRIIHTAQWDQSLDLSGKKVAVVGTGASAIQVIPSIANKVSELHVFQRKPVWIVTRNQMTFSNTMQSIFKAMPIIGWVFRMIIFVSSELLHGGFRDGNILNSLGGFERMMVVFLMMVSYCITKSKVSMTLIIQHFPSIFREPRPHDDAEEMDKRQEAERKANPDL